MKILKTLLDVEFLIMFLFQGGVKISGHCHITGKYKSLAQRDCNIKVKLNHKIPIVFHNLKNYNSYFIM